MIDRSSDLRVASATEVNPLWTPIPEQKKWYWMPLISDVRFGIIHEAWILVEDGLACRAHYAPATWEFA